MSRRHRHRLPAAAPVVDDKFSEGVKIKHDRAATPAPTEKPAAAPAQVTNNNTTQVQQDEDGVTLRWR